MFTLKRTLKQIGDKNDICGKKPHLFFGGNGLKSHVIVISCSFFLMEVPHRRNPEVDAGVELSKRPSIFQYWLRARDQKEFLLRCRNILWDSASLSGTTFQSVCCVYGGFSFSLHKPLYSWHVTWRWTSVRWLDPSRSHSVVINCTLCTCVCRRGWCVHVRVRLAWQSGLDVKHLLGDSFGCRCGVTPRHICRGAGDPCNLPLVRPQLHHSNHFSDDCVIFPPLHRGSFTNVTSCLFPQLRTLGNSRCIARGRFGNGKHNETQKPGEKNSNAQDMLHICDVVQTAEDGGQD